MKKKKGEIKSINHDLKKLILTPDKENEKTKVFERKLRQNYEHDNKMRCMEERNFEYKYKISKKK